MCPARVVSESTAEVDRRAYGKDGAAWWASDRRNRTWVCDCDQLRTRRSVAGAVRGRPGDSGGTQRIWVSQCAAIASYPVDCDPGTVVGRGWSAHCDISSTRSSNVPGNIDVRRTTDDWKFVVVNLNVEFATGRVARRICGSTRNESCAFVEGRTGRWRTS